MRITCPKELNRLIATGRIRSGASPDELKRALKTSKLSSKRKQPTADLSLLPPVEPSARLYQALVAVYGRFAEGGEVVHELSAPFTGRKWALDMALPRWRIGIEMDGWQYHGKFKEGFQRDREKQTDFARFGWLLFRVSNKQVNHSLDDVILAIQQSTKFVPRFEHVDIKETSFGRHACMSNPFLDSNA